MRKVPLAWRIGIAKSQTTPGPEGTFRVKITGRKAKIVVSADGSGIVCQAGGLLLAETLRVSGLGDGLSAGLEPWRRPGAVHDPGKIVADLAGARTLGGDCLADIAVLPSSPAWY